MPRVQGGSNDPLLEPRALRRRYCGGRQRGALFGGHVVLLIVRNRFGRLPLAKYAHTVRGKRDHGDADERQVKGGRIVGILLQDGTRGKLA